MECQGLFKTYAPLYKSLGYTSNYVQTYAQNGATVTTTAQGAVGHGGMVGSHYYAPKVTTALTHDMRNSYADMLSHQSSYLLKHENAMKS